MSVGPRTEGSVNLLCFRGFRIFSFFALRPHCFVPNFKFLGQRNVPYISKFPLGGFSLSVCHKGQGRTCIASGKQELLNLVLLHIILCQIKDPNLLFSKYARIIIMIFIMPHCLLQTVLNTVSIMKQ